MNLGTMERAITEDLHTLVSQAQIWRKIIQSIRHHRDNRLWFSERRFEFSTKAGLRSYRAGAELPGDLVEIVSDVLRLGLSSGSSYSEAVERVPSEVMEGLIAGDTGQSRPDYWDWLENSLRLSPLPDQAYVVSGRYVRDIGVPVYEWNGTQWLFKTPDVAANLSAEFTNDWFGAVRGFDMVKNYAIYLLQKTYLKDLVAANEAMVTWQEAVAVLEGETEGRTGGLTLTPSLLE